MNRSVAESRTPWSRNNLPPVAEVERIYDQAAPGYDARWAKSPRTVRRFSILEMPFRRMATDAHAVLVLGCGTGRVQQTLDAPSVLGIDLSVEMLRHAATRGLRVAQANAYALPFANDSFDLVIAANGVFRYLDYSRAMLQCARVLRPGGRLALHQYAARTWSVRVLLRRRPGSPLHLTSVEELNAAALTRGLHVRTARYWRNLPIFPYVMPVPRWLIGRWWTHVVVEFRKTGWAPPTGSPPWACPDCLTPLTQEPEHLVCSTCDRQYNVDGNIPSLLIR